MISRRVLVYFTLTVQHFSWNILDFLFRTANLISFLVIVPQGVLNGALTDFLSAIIEVGSHELWFWFVYSAVFQSIKNSEKRKLWCSWEFSCLCIFMHFGMKVISVWVKQNYTGRTRAYLCVAGYDTQFFWLYIIFNYILVLLYQSIIQRVLNIHFSCFARSHLGLGAGTCWSTCWF